MSTDGSTIVMTFMPQAHRQRHRQLPRRLFWNAATGTNTLLTKATGTEGESWANFMSGDASIVLINSHAQLTGDDNDEYMDAYVWDATSGTLCYSTKAVGLRASHGWARPARKTGPRFNWRPCAAHPADDTDAYADVYMWAAETGVKTLLTKAAGQEGDSFIGAVTLMATGS